MFESLTITTIKTIITDAYEQVRYYWGEKKQDTFESIV